MKENGFTLKRQEADDTPTETMMGADYTDDKALLVSTPIQTESLLRSLEQAAGGIGLHMNAMSYSEQIPEAISYKTEAVQPPTSHL